MARASTRPPFLLTRSVEVTVIRPGKVENQYGVPVTLPPTCHTIEANVQPLRFTELSILPDVDRNKGWIKMYTHLDADIRIAKDGDGGWKEDVVLWGGEEWAVMKIQRWKMGVLDHQCVHASRIPPPGSGMVCPEENNDDEDNTED